tara:strand:+ start:8630 stop:9337 length:708 start_codon:yes stop_codon:yes gene_type:complete
MEILKLETDLKLNKVSFLTTIFPKNKNFLIEFFDSLKNQTYKNFDVIVINDGYDNFEKIKKKYSKILNIIEVKYSNLPKKNKEYGINYCIDKNYNILIFGDSDDYFGSNRIEKSINLLKKYDIVVNDLSLFDQKGIIVNKYFSRRLKNLDLVDYEFIKDKNIFGLSNTAINLENISKVNFDNCNEIVDWYFFKKLLRQDLKAVFTNEIISYYRQHQNNVIGLSGQNRGYKLWGEK